MERMQTISEESSFSRKLREDEGPRATGSLVLWTAAIAVLIGLNFASWSFCMWVFGQPEQPMNYKLLTKLDRLEPIHGFLPVTAPRGRFYSAKDLYAQVYHFDEREMRAYNGILKRHYLRNYLERSDVIFISGEFVVESVQRMEPGDVFASGLVIRARSSEFPDAIVELALPSEEVPERFELAAGEILQIQQSTMCAALLHVDRGGEPEMVFTVVPLVTKTPGESPEDPPLPKTFEFGDEASIAVRAQETIDLSPRNWPISRESEGGFQFPLPWQETPEDAESEAEEVGEAAS